MVSICDQKEYEYLESLSEYPEPRVRAKIKKVLKELRDKFKDSKKQDNKTSYTNVNHTLNSSKEAILGAYNATTKKVESTSDIFKIDFEISAENNQSFEFHENESLNNTLIKKTDIISEIHFFLKEITNKFKL